MPSATLTVYCAIHVAKCAKDKKDYKLIFSKFFFTLAELQATLNRLVESFT